MAAHMNLVSGGTLETVEAEDAPPALNDLLALASWVAVRWGEFDGEARAAMIRRIQQVAADVGRQAHPNGNGNGRDPDDGHLPLEQLVMLTPREFQVLQAMADGRSTSGIASALGISPATVRSHVKRLLAKLGLHSRVEAVSLILRSNNSHSSDNQPT